MGSAKACASRRRVAHTVRLEAETDRVLRRREILQTSVTKTTEPVEKVTTGLISGPKTGSNTTEIGQLTRAAPSSSFSAQPWLLLGSFLRAFEHTLYRLHPGVFRHSPRLRGMSLRFL